MTLTRQLSRTLIITVIAAICCFIFAFYFSSQTQIALNGYKDCRKIDGFTPDSNCANRVIIKNIENLEFKGQALFFSGLGLIFVSLLIIWRKNKSKNIKFDSILST